MMAFVHDATSSDFTHDVFLVSFSGENNKDAFADYLYQALLDNRITTVRYDGAATHAPPPPPDTIITKSRISMVVLCDNYANSTVCLDVLVKIIDQYCYDDDAKRNKRHVSVIFNKVEPSDVWLQEHSYAAAMIKHEERFGQGSEKVKAWRLALSRIRDLGGDHCRGDKYESGFIKKIVKDTSSKLPPPPVPLEIRHPIGLESRFGQVKSLLDIESNTGVCMLGIYGDAGIGKTTLAAFLYNKIRHRFQAASFLTNIREKSNSNSISGLEDLQRTLLYETVKETQTMVHTTFERDSQIKRKLTHKRVLLILDDVDSIKQLEALAGGCHWFGSGSRIIITTRVESELDKHDVAITKYKMEELNSSDSLELLCWHAFNMSKPKEHYADICNHAVSFAKGFPRALKVLGSNLKGLSTGEWEMELEKYEKVPDAFSFLVGSF